MSDVKPDWAGGAAANETKPDPFKIMTEAEFVASGKDVGEYGLYVVEMNHVIATVKPQVDENIKRSASLPRNISEDEKRQREQDEKIVTGEPEGITHMDLLKASMHIDNRLKAIANGEEAEEVEPSPRVINTPHGFEPSKPNPAVWKPGK